jgi:hypothetical protein
VSNLRDYETLKTLRTDILAKNRSFVSDKALLFWQQKFSQSFMIFGRKGKEKTTLDHKYQICSNLCVAKKQGRLQWTQKAKDPTNVISHHELVKLIINRALNHTQITWRDLIVPDRPLQIEQHEVHHEITPQGIEDS